MINQSAEEDNRFIVTVQLFKDGEIFETIQNDVFTSEPTARGHYDKIKNDLKAACIERYPNSTFEAVVLNEEKP